MEHFKMQEFIKSATAEKYGIDNSPEVYGEHFVYENLEMLVLCVLDPLRAAFDSPIVISSGYRCERVNALCAGALNSQHRKGLAADFYFADGSVRKLREAVLYILGNLDFDQMIYYRKGEFIHVSFVSESENRRSFMVR